MAFSDFPDREKLCYPSADEYLHYLQRYARHFDLERYITYHSRVYSAVSGHDRGWSLEIRQLKKQTTLSILADALIIATGANQVPNQVPLVLAEFGLQRQI
jgi:dimethylaniline monooxygenase (N-oxide forming)